METSYLFGFKNMLGNPIDVLFTKERALKILDDLSPDKTFILIDSTNKTFNSDYLTSTELLYTRNYKCAYKMNDIPANILEHLKEVKSIDGYNFTLREENDDYSKIKRFN